MGSQGFHQSLGHHLSHAGSLDLILMGSVLGGVVMVSSSVGKRSDSGVERTSSWPFPELFEVHLFLLRGSVSTCSIFTLGLALILGFCIPLIRKNPSLNSAFPI